MSARQISNRRDFVKGALMSAAAVRAGTGVLAAAVQGAPAAKSKVVISRDALLRGSVIKFAYRIYRKANQEGKERELLAEGETVHVVCDDQLNRKPLPEKYAAALRAAMAEE